MPLRLIRSLEWSLLLFLILLGLFLSAHRAGVLGYLVKLAKAGEFVLEFLGQGGVFGFSVNRIQLVRVFFQIVELDSTLRFGELLHSVVQ